MVSVTLGELSQLLQVPLNAAGEKVRGLHIAGLATLASAVPGQLSFLSNPRYTSQLMTSRASAFIVHPDTAGCAELPCLLSKAPYVTFAYASQFFAGQQTQAHADRDDLPLIHASADVSSQAILAEDVRVGAHAVIEAGAVIGAATTIGAGCYVGRGVSIGKDCILHPNVTLYHGVSLKDRGILHSGTVIGADGFGFAFDGEKSVKIAQLGTVRLGCDVEVGAGTTIDRGALDDTLIGDGVKIDNQVQIGHNCVVGDHTVICGCTALAGSTTVGRYCMIGGGVGITGHLSISDRVSISAMSMVTRSIEKPGVYSSGTLLQESGQWRRNAITLSRLSELSQTVRNIEKRVPPGNVPDSGN
tara:strand:- start:9486 stop:10562 length:1077 start_codon:yes stop_codon:yes gene_type:complete